MFGLSGFEIGIILLFAFLIFGPDKMPDMARTIGRAVRQFRSAQEQMTKVIKTEVYDPIKDLEPLMNPFEGFSLDVTGDAAKTGAKKEADKKSALKPQGSKAVDGKGLTADAGVLDGEGEQNLSSEEVAAALSSEADKAKKRALRETAKQTGVATPYSASFAERRARLEQEHAKAKKAAEEQAAAEQAAVEQPAGEQSAAEQPVAGQPSDGQPSETKPPAVSDERKEDEKSD